MDSNFFKNFRKLSTAKRIEKIGELEGLSVDDLSEMSDSSGLLDLASVLIENEIGFFGVPFGVATGFLINGKEYSLPMATEEPSVIAGATYAGGVIRGVGGFTTIDTDAVMTVQIYLQNCTVDKSEIILSHEDNIKKKLEVTLSSLYQRGGGYRGIDIKMVQSDILRVHLHLAVCDAMGANKLNSGAEVIAPLLEQLTGGKAILRILTNLPLKRVAQAKFAIPVRKLKRAGLSGEEVAINIVTANLIASVDSARAATHNKGIMNGISALTLATGNDTRGMAAAAHSYAALSGNYKALTEYKIENGMLHGKIKLPVTLGTVGGAVGLHPAAKVSLAIMGNPDAKELSGIVCALGLAQNFAALWALVSEGIQAGHMRLQAKSLAYSVGARGEQLFILAEKLWKSSKLDEFEARKIFSGMEKL